MSSVETLVFRPATLPPLSRVVLRAAVLVMTWETRAKTRKQLRKLDRNILKDIGIDPMTAEAEAERPFWRL